MSELSQPDLAWPPSDFEEMGKIKDLSGQAMSKDPHTARVIGASYTIDISPLVRGSKNYNLYSFQIDGWEYSISNESREFPVLSFLLRSGNGYRGISNIKSLACPLPTTPKSAQRSYITAVTMMRSIADGVVPDMEEYLKLNKIHPSQRSLYESEGTAARRFFDIFDKTKKETQFL